MPTGIYKRKPHTEETKRKIGLGNSGKKFSKEHKQKLRERAFGKKPALGKHWKLSEETKKKKSLAMSGAKNPMYGKKRLDITGEKNPNWKGGIANKPYSVDWTDDLKRAIRKRDKYTCQICNKEPAICVHHIDYNKKNCNPDNLITLCGKCHPKTNHNREYWINNFKDLSNL